MNMRGEFDSHNFHQMKIEWIEINLPYEHHPNYDDMPKLNLEEKEVAEFGITREEALMKFYDDAHEKQPGKSILDLDLLESDTWDDKYYKWQSLQPETKEYNKKMDEWEAAQENVKSFRLMGLNKPGTLIRLKNGTIHLIGTINTNCGVCDDCTAFGGNTVIESYSISLLEAFNLKF